MAAAKSDESTAARGAPFLTLSPGETSNRDTGPEIGAMTLVAWSLSKSTVPLVSMVL